MTSFASPDSRLRAALDRYLGWLRVDAFPLWATIGLDPAGGFQEKIRLDGTTTADNRRARVQTRQVFSYAQAPALGWTGDAQAPAAQGLAWFLDHFRRPDGLFRTVVAPDGTPVDDRAFLYDQAFVLLALAESQKLWGPRADLVEEGRRLRSALAPLSAGPGAGFFSGDPERLPLLSNPHMHLFEAALAWAEASDDPEWRNLADMIGRLALSRLIDRGSGALRETYTADWAPASGPAGRIVEPGHQFEWAWLLLRWGGPDPAATRAAAFRLIELGERHGVIGEFAINALVDDLSVHDAATRLWPQTERLKAALRAAELTGDVAHWGHAADAAECLLRFLDVPVAGIWRDRVTLEGRFVEEPAPASSFYHIIVAIAELARVMPPA